MVWTGELVSLFISYPITEKRVRNDDFGGCPQDLCALRLVVIIKKEVEWEVESVKSYMKLFIESANVDQPFYYFFDFLSNFFYYKMFHNTSNIDTI